MIIKRAIAVFIIFSFFLTGCAENKRTISIGPPVSSSYYEPEDDGLQLDTPIIDIIVPVFSPGLPDDPADYDDNNIWPELRRAEATRFAHKLKDKLEQTEMFGAIRVTPDQTATGDLYVLGKIEQSNGEEVEIAIEVIDISGRVWLRDTFEHEVPENYHSDVRNEGLDPYDPVFVEVATELVQELQSYNRKYLEDLHYLSDLRFGANFSEQSFRQYMETDAGLYRLVGKPSDQDPMLQRIKAIRVRDQLFVDGLQDNYSAFSEQMNESYQMWQKQSLLEIQARREANKKALGQAAGGVLMIGLAILSAVAGASSDVPGSTSAGTTGAILGGMAATSLITESFRTSAEAKVHRESLNELGQSVDMELAPQVVAFEKETVELTGDAREQYTQWRTFLQKIYLEEQTPDVQL